MLRVGVHRNNLHLTLARTLFPKERLIEWTLYDDGRTTGDLIRAGAIDVGGTGSTPPLVAQAAGVDLVYVAASAARPANGAILVRAELDIGSIEQLAGKRIALIEGSFHTYLLAALAEAKGLTLNAFQRVDLAPAASVEALRSGEVDAWIGMDPHLGAELARGGVRVLPESAGAIPNRSLFWASREAALKRADELRALLKLLASVAPAVADRPDALALTLAASGDADEAQWRKVLASRDWALQSADQAVLAEQQHEADTLARNGALPRVITVADAAWTSPRSIAA
ncbi:ABC transporter substrate-binding protein [Terrarubrum flagellatum]|uniref:ABC transporter substrate-binding protein n=1 Tax=Terrirubrum flagellatum TaxID=2895980 RepID=UPI0031452479